MVGTWRVEIAVSTCGPRINGRMPMPPQTRIADWGATLNHQPVIADDPGPSLQNCYKPVRAARAMSTVLVGV